MHKRDRQFKEQDKTKKESTFQRVWLVIANISFNQFASYLFRPMNHILLDIHSIWRSLSLLLAFLPEFNIIITLQ